MNQIDPVEFGKLIQGLESLTELTKVGFKNINERLDKQNGRIKIIETWQSNRTFLEKCSVWILGFIFGSGGIVAFLKLTGKL